MNLNSTIKGKIKSHSEKVFPEECCGLLIEDEEGGIDVVECENSSEDKESLFKISTEEYLEALSQGDIVAVYHSHTKGDNSFSEADKDISESLELNSILYISSKDEFQIMEAKKA
jgi:proteasome lid subunit RPN8/RPN11